MRRTVQRGAVRSGRLLLSDGIQTSKNFWEKIREDFGSVRLENDEQRRNGRDDHQRTVVHRAEKYFHFQRKFRTVLSSDADRKARIGHSQCSSGGDGRFRRSSPPSMFDGFLSFRSIASTNTTRERSKNFSFRFGICSANRSGERVEVGRTIRRVLQALCAENPEQETMALKSITALMQLIGKSIQNDETEISTKKFVDRAIRGAEPRGNFL